MIDPIPWGISQVGQDRFAWEVSGRKQHGIFVDIGCSDGVTGSNSLALERLGWRGLLVDKNHNPRIKELRPQSHYIVSDALGISWPLAFMDFPNQIDFLSLDTDGDGFKVLQTLPLDTFRFSAITIEHDKYDNGDRLRGPMRELLMLHRYHLLCSDVCDSKTEFEDWWVDPRTVDMTRLERFRSDKMDGREILKR